jgi:histidinol dehydrogenase
VFNLKVIKGYEKALKKLSRKSESMFTADIEKAVRDTIVKVRLDGDKALREYTLKYDGVEINSLEVPPEKLVKAYEKIDKELLVALEMAAKRIKDYHSRQKKAIWQAVAEMDGKQLVKPLERVGIYIPGGRACYPSTVMMTVILAKVAGVKEVFVVTPPAEDGEVSNVTLAALRITGADKVFRIGGAQAIAALAYGTKTVPKVDKICGPGNIYVAMAKKLVYGVVDIDGLQGPSEMVMIADRKSNPAWCASDMLAQAEHDTMASAIMITDSAELAEKVEKEINSQLEDISRQEIAKESLEERGLIVIVSNTDEVIELVNTYAPEHLLLMIAEPRLYIDIIENAGCIVKGDRATVVIGDYIAGPSHALPTGGTAKFASPLNINDFIKLIDVVDVGEEEIKVLGKSSQIIARAEGLEGHAKTIEKRLD